MIVAATIGSLRQIENIANARHGRNGETGRQDWQLHIEGAMGEQALAKWLGMFWSGQVGDLSAADVGKRVEARTTNRQNGRLILHDWDRDDGYYFLVIGQNGIYRIAGWMRGAFGKAAEFWGDPVGGRPAYFIPQHKLASPYKFFPSPSPAFQEQSYERSRATNGR
jgi:hypothetical protein